MPGNAEKRGQPARNHRNTTKHGKKRLAKDPWSTVFLPETFLALFGCVSVMTGWLATLLCIAGYAWELLN